MPADRHATAYIRTISELDGYGEHWDRFAADAKRFHPCYAEARLELERQSFLVAVRFGDGAASGLACFVNRRTEQVLTLGERRLCGLRARETSLFGGQVLGVFGEKGLGECLRTAFHEWPCDLFTLGEVEIGSELDRATVALGGGILRTRRQRKDPVRWLIALPRTFDGYLAQLRPRTRKWIAYTLRRFERDLPYAHEVVTRPEQVDYFLREGERVSRQTYQWTVGQRVENDEATRQRYLRLAAQGRLRCHLLRVHGEPSAFARTEINGGICHYETPGFLPEHRKYSPGAVLLLWAIRDLIENTSCTVFDFGAGGDEHGYKARFGTVPIYCRDLQLAPVWRPYSAALWATHFTLSAAKDLASVTLGSGAIRQRIKKAIRRYGSESP